MATERPPEGEEPRRQRPARPDAENIPDLPDPRMLERAMRQYLGGGADPATPQGQAEELIAQAFEETNPQQTPGNARFLPAISASAMPS